jgi:hypothetical protein
MEMPPLQDSQFVNDVARAIVLDRIDNLGEAASGAGSYYKQRAAAPNFLTSYEIRLAEYLLSAPTARSYHEIGCGFGALPVLLAANGLTTVGIDSERKRVDGSQSILIEVTRKLIAEKRPMLGSCEFLHGAFPAIMAGRDVQNCVALLTNITSTITPDQRRSIIEALKNYAVVILDLQRFIDRRTVVYEEDALLAELVAMGLGRPSEIFNLGAAGRYVRFDRQ